MLRSCRRAAVRNSGLTQVLLNLVGLKLLEQLGLIDRGNARAGIAHRDGERSVEGELASLDLGQIEHVVD